MQNDLYDQLTKAINKLSIQQVRVGAIADEMETADLRIYAEESGTSYSILLKCSAMFRMAKSVKALITDERYEEVPEEQESNDEDLYAHLR
jgi:hypothetical protein